MPLWYGGIPFPDSYPPLLHVTVAAVSALAHISAGLAYHAVTAVLYSLGACRSLLGCCRGWERRPPTAFLAATRILAALAHHLAGPIVPPRYWRLVRAVPSGRDGELGRGPAHHLADAAAYGGRRALHRNASAGPRQLLRRGSGHGGRRVQQLDRRLRAGATSARPSCWRNSRARGCVWLSSPAGPMPSRRHS